MKIEFTWPDHIIPLVIGNERGEYVIDLFINSLLLENDEGLARRMTRIVVDLTKDSVPLWRWELPMTALSSHLEVDADISRYSKQVRDQMVGCYLAPKIRKLIHGSSLQPGEQAILRRFPIRFTARFVPDQIVIRIYSGQHLIGRRGVKLDTMDNFADRRFPLKGVWQVAKNFDFTLSHRQSAAQEFAIDLYQLWENGLIYKDDPDKLENYACFQKPVLAMAAGEVVLTEERLPNNRPNEIPNETHQESVMKKHGFIQAYKGNCVQIKHQDGTYSFYAHLDCGSLKVKTGDRVEAGQQIGNIGNSGFSNHPHLHVQVNDGDNPLGNRSLPLSFSNLFDREGKNIHRVAHNFSIVHTQD